MDRTLKERIIGITVLVVFAVIIVPVFLNGPSDEPEVISESLTLPGQNSASQETQKIVLKRDRSEPVPAANHAPPTTNATDEQAEPVPDQPVATSSESRPPPSAPAAASTTETQVEAQAEAVKSETGMWAVQLGSFSNQENAERLAAELRKQGYAAFLSQLKTANGTLQRVRIGPQKDRESAEAVAAKLKLAGHASQVVPHP
jgi:DedD protein